MSFSATVFKVLIASPGDVLPEREAITEVIMQWNNINSETTNIVLLPVKWETYSAPMLGDRPQGIINNQVVSTCDMAIGVFWTRLGSPTGVSESGTAEEIEWFINHNKPVMVYFSSQAIEPSVLDIDQYKALKDFEKKMQKIGLTGTYKNIVDFKEKLLTQLSINIKAIQSGNGINFSTPEETDKKNREIHKIIKSGKVYMEDYEKDGEIKSFLVKGDTKPIKDKLKEAGGRWNPSLKGWVFPKSHEISVAVIIKTYT